MVANMVAALQGEESVRADAEKEAALAQGRAKEAETEASVLRHALEARSPSPLRAPCCAARCASSAGRSLTALQPTAELRKLSPALCARFTAGCRLGQEGGRERQRRRENGGAAPPQKGADWGSRWSEHWRRAAIA